MPDAHQAGLVFPPSLDPTPAAIAELAKAAHAFGEALTLYHRDLAGKHVGAIKTEVGRSVLMGLLDAIWAIQRVQGSNGPILSQPDKIEGWPINENGECSSVYDAVDLVVEYLQEVYCVIHRPQTEVTFRLLRGDLETFQAIFYRPYESSEPIFFWIAPLSAEELVPHLAKIGLIDLSGQDGDYSARTRYRAVTLLNAWRGGKKPPDGLFQTLSTSTKMFDAEKYFWPDCESETKIAEIIFGCARCLDRCLVPLTNFVVNDSEGSRRLFIPPEQLPYGELSNLKKDFDESFLRRLKEIELDGPRLKDGGNPIWFIREYDKYSSSPELRSKCTWLQYCERLFPDEVEVRDPASPLDIAARVANEGTDTKTAAASGNVPANSTETLFVPTPLQKNILESLDGTALTKTPLAKVVCGGEWQRLYKPGGIKELKAAGLVDNKRGVGYFRPDAPPPGSVMVPARPPEPIHD